MSILTNEMVSELARSLNINEPTPSQPKYDNPVSRLHEIGHFAVKGVDWYVRWCAALKPRQLEMMSACGCPWIPTIEYNSADPLPDEYGVQLWTALTLRWMNVEFDANDPKLPILDKGANSCIDPTWGHCKDPWVQLSVWNINPLQGRFLPIDDGFVLPYPDGAKWFEIIENLCAIQERHPTLVPRHIDYPKVIAGARLKALMRRFPG